jgi:hypothetical protein
MKKMFTMNILLTDGPVSANLTDPGVFDLDPNNRNKAMTLTCSTSNSNPGVRYTWSGPCAGQTSRTCSFVPDLTQDNKLITCVAVNPALCLQTLPPTPQ